MRKKGERTIQAIDTTTRSALDSFDLITLRAYLGDSETTLDAEVVSATYTASVGGGDGFSIGNACSAELVIVLAGVGTTAGNQSLRVTWDAAGTEYPLFTGTVSKATTSGSQTTLTAYDALDSVSNTPYEPALTGSCTAAEALADIAAQMGVELDGDTKTLAAGTALTEGVAALEGLRLSSAAANIALLLGGNAVITRAGALAVRRFTDCGWETESYAGGATPEDTAYTVDGLTFQRTDTATATDEDGITTESSTSTDYTASASTGAGLTYSTNLATQALVDGAYMALSGLSFRAGSFSVQGGLFVEPGDLIAVDGLTVAVSGISLSLDGGCKTTITSLGQSDTGSTGGSITQAISAIQQDYAEFKTMVADNISATNANFTNVLAGYVKADELEATVATFGYVTADSAVITDLTAQVATISAAYITAADVETLLADYATINELTAYKAEITELTAGYVTAGEVDAILVE
ncbi:MAG: hypothetical protein LUF28_08555, partial [Clostridiales bacterium]|nr:hypothetical protein [Clostridiales bacterium]